MDFHVFGSGNSKHSTQGSEFSNRSKSLSVVQMRFLRETFGHKPSLIAIHRAIRLHLDAIHPAATNSFPTRGQFTQFPNSVLKKCIVLLLGSSCQRPASSRLIASLYVLGSTPEVRKAYSMSSETERAWTALASSGVAISASAADSESLPLCLERLCCSLACWYGWLTFHHSPVGRTERPERVT